MKNQNELDAFVADLKSRYPDYKTNPEAATEIRNHPDYSHVTIRQSWEANCVYFYVDNSPTRVSWALTFDKPMLKYLEAPLTLAINNRW